MKREAEVSLELGRLRGCVEDGVEVYRGIPYAAPPVGALRLQPPQAPRPWERLRSAEAFGPAPPQRPDPLGQVLGLLGDAPTDEDCLTLNVFTPGCDDRRRPVMLFLHGGAFQTGTGGVPLYDGRRLAARGGVVVVTLNYRVGALGFLQLEGEGGNFGLLDQIAALRFLARHAGAFGGDPHNVTLFGESAGAGSIVALLGMPAAKRLFRRAIIQSAAPAGMLGLEEARGRADALRSRLGVSDEAGLRAAPVEALLDAQAACAAAGPHRTGMLFAPVVDGDRLPVHPLGAVAAGVAAGVDVLIGTTREEMQLYAFGADPSAMDDGRLAAILAGQLDGLVARPADTAAALIDGFRAIRSERGEDTSAAALYYAIVTELGLRYHATVLAGAQARHNPSTFMYLFSWPSPMQEGLLGACHAIDLPFTLGNLDAPGMSAFAGAGDAAERLAANLMDAWASFARGGNPSHAGIGEWPRYEASRRATFELGEECRVLEAPFEAERALLERLGIGPLG